VFELKVVRERRAGYGQRRRFTKAQDVYEAFRDRWERADREEFLVIPLDAKTSTGLSCGQCGHPDSSLVHRAKYSRSRSWGTQQHSFFYIFTRPAIRSLP